MVPSRKGDPPHELDRENGSKRQELSVVLSSTSLQIVCSSVSYARITYMNRDLDQMKSRGPFKHKLFYEFEKLY